MLSLSSFNRDRGLLRGLLGGCKEAFQLFWSANMSSLGADKKFQALPGQLKDSDKPPIVLCGYRSCVSCTQAFETHTHS